MRRYTYLIIILFTLFSTLILAPNLYCQKKTRHKTSSAKSSLRFKMIASGDGGGFSRQVYKSSDGMTLIRTGEVFASDALAKEELEFRIKNAIKIIKREQTKENGVVTGERAVVLLNKKGYAAIFGVIDTVFWSIRAPSLRHILVFEKQYE